MEFKPKTEWPNCPQWLLDADTKDEKVHVDEDGCVTWGGGRGDFRAHILAACVYAEEIEKRLKTLDPKGE